MLHRPPLWHAVPGATAYDFQGRHLDVVTGGGPGPGGRLTDALGSWALSYTASDEEGSTTVYRLVQVGPPPRCVFVCRPCTIRPVC